MTYTNITCICINVQSYIRYVTLHYIALHYITYVLYMYMHMCMCIWICICVCLYLYVCVYVNLYVYVLYMYCICISTYEYMYIYIYDLTFYKGYQKLIHSRARPCPMAAMRASRMGEAQKCMLTIWWVWWLLLFPAGNHHWSSPSGPKDSMDQWIVPHSCHPTYLYISNKRSKRCSIRLLWLGMTVAIATGLFIVCEEILSRSSRDEPNSRSTDFLNNTAACFLDLLWWENAWRAWRCGVLQILQLQNI